MQYAHTWSGTRGPHVHGLILHHYEAKFIGNVLCNLQGHEGSCKTLTMESEASLDCRTDPDLMAGEFAGYSGDGPVPTDFLLPYEPPDWMSDLQKIPKYRVQLIHGITPIQRWYLPNVPADFEIHIKRDDMTGCELSGNKARKLEFLLADAIHQGCSAVITCGSMQSNHCRATALAVRQLGLEPHLLLRSPVSDPAEVTCSGNMLLNRLVGAHVYLMPRKSQFAGDIKPRLDQLVQKIKEETGESAYPIPIGGSTAVGLYGYLEGFAELQRQGVVEKFTDIVIACGSSGSTLGLALANYLTNSKLKVHGMIVSDDSQYHYKEMNKVLREVDAKHSNGKALQAEDIVNLVDGVKGRGYGLSTPEELDKVAEICAKTGIIIDPIYTGKSVHHLIQLTREKPDMFKGSKILFVHTGGIFGLFDGRMDETIKRVGLEQNKFHEWMELAVQAPDLNL
ncbi:bifunctional D-cysteine desulfhydrase/1-aminocyclopropane-1-carboxylate deaminase, mitochondrial-like isoform X2 [Acanthaster planci]|uniref:Bifunctional D-cysteine desulfhydrase/1-aminocyclopropane-1-carboxylate deaminase, mitochondrial-like isoform X2 n=1 Tax=Acanthaster planci TaxID=133434 RepID=A0A8B7YKP0_ACAPL|nr:bifunctional D-cysteine desulfhydrase/1-aminocyclopropane-1-carboxylate deaminase, mitochondrial-like isoform X2 [Acanthaster planci]